MTERRPTAPIRRCAPALELLRRRRAAAIAIAMSIAVGALVSSACRSRHLPDSNTRLRAAAYPEGEQTPPSWLYGMGHDRDFLVRHRWVAADHGELCASCHSEEECVDCHDGRVRIVRVHPNDYLAIHSTMARRDDPTCTSCHTTQSFCHECHARLGLSTVSAPRSRGGGRYHPPNEVWLRGPVLHGREARRSMTTCVSCHAENDCVECHGSLGIGAGISPHRPDFIDRCGAALARNERACVRCHGDLSVLRERCR